MSDTVTFLMSGTVMTQIQGSELYLNPAKYDPGDPATVLACRALHLTKDRRHGKGGRSHEVTCSPAAARVIQEYCEDVGTAFAGQMDTDVRADGRALLKVADRITAVLKQ